MGDSTSCKDSGKYLTKFLRKGYKNDVESVKKLQSFLNTHLGLNIPVTGIFGQLTEDAVKALQLKHRETMLSPWGTGTPTGIVYLTTLTGINNLMCADLKLEIPTDLIPFNQNPEV